MPSNRKILFCSIIFILLFILAFPLQSAQEIKRIAIIPFEIHSRNNADLFQKAIYEGLSDQLAKLKNIQLINKEKFLSQLEGKKFDDKLLLSIGRQENATFILTGSLTELGESISIDVRIMDVRKGVFLPLIFAQGISSEGIAPLTVKLIGEIIIRIEAEQRIARIEFKGNRRIESSAINQVLKSSAGSVFSETNLAQDIKAIYKMGYFTDVSAKADDVPEGKVITFSVQEKGIITAINIKGNKAISKDDVEAALTVKTKQILNQEKIKADVERIKNLYDNKGYYNAEITDAVEGDKDVQVLFNIVENERLYIRSINFSGNEAYTAKELRKIMATNEVGLFHFITDSGILKKELLKQDVEKINAFYLNNGFIYAQVGEPEVSHDKRGIYIKVPVTEGKQYQVGKVDISGDELKVSRYDLMKQLLVNKKKYYDRQAVMKDIDYIQQMCSDEGYAYADVIPKTIPQDKSLTVDVNYQITKGKQVYFNRINITGNTKTRDKVIRRLLSVVEGDLYNKSKLKESYMEINRLRYFDEVDFQTEKGPDETLSNVNIRVKEKPTGIFSIGAGYSALDKAVFTAQVAQQNLFGRGQSLSLRANIGARITNYDLSFTEPWLFDLPLWSKFNIWKMNREYDTYDLNSQGGGFTFGYPLWKHVTGYAGYTLSTNDITNINENASSYIKLQEGTTTTSSMTLTLTRDTTDDFVFPAKGSKNSLSMEYAGGFLQGDARFTKYEASSAWFFSLPLDVVFGIRGRGGYIQQMGGKDVPVYERFYLGGINSLRGLRSIGPVDPFTGDVIGGLTMLNINTEFLFPLLKEAGMKGVIFFDTGNSWENGYNLDDMRKTAGIGVRWFSPIGPLRLEWGYVLDRKNNEPSTRWEFTIGMFM